jgi:hypothetical protein
MQSLQNFRGIGQPWRFELGLKDVLYPGKEPEDITENEVRHACVEVHKRLLEFAADPSRYARVGEADNRLPNYGRIPINAIAERFDRLGKSDLVDVMYFNNDLDLLYDWADANRVLIK